MRMFSKKKLIVSVIFSLALVMLFTSCGKNGNEKTSGSKEILGAGATFPYPLYSKMFDVYNKEKNIKVNYQSVGSGAGIQQLINRTVDFGASDAFMTDEEIKKAPGEIVEIPTCLGAVVVIYNLEENPALKFNSKVLSDIFLGKITKWNDPMIRALNAEVKLPDQNITVVHRSDGSGTTFLFTDYLTKISEDWKNSVGTGKSVNWPVGLGAKGNEGVGGLVKQTPGSIGYVELIYAQQNNMASAKLQNKTGVFIAPTLQSIKAAALIDFSENIRVSLTNTQVESGYPISGFTWLMIYKDQKYGNRTEENAKDLVNLLWWITHEGQQYAEPLSYAVLPNDVVKKVEAILKSVTFGDKKVLSK